ncbi:MAG: endonuclease/exonuclease/phosphatase family protein [Acidimicrobiia bacterium]
MTRFMDATFRLMTANLLHDRCDLADFARILAARDPDILVTQELGPQCAEIVTSAYPNHLLRPSLELTGRGIATRFDAEFASIDIHRREGTSALLDVDGQTLRLAGVHLLNPINFPWWVSARGRARQLAGLFEWLEDGEGPVVVAGDLNASPVWPAYRQVAARLTDLVTARAEAEGTRASATWGWRPGWPKMLRIDHVFGSGVAAARVEVEPIAGSDHSAVLVDLRFDSGVAEET